jgi:hypothetical protein
MLPFPDNPMIRRYTLTGVARCAHGTGERFHPRREHHLGVSVELERKVTLSPVSAGIKTGQKPSQRYLKFLKARAFSCQPSELSSSGFYCENHVRNKRHVLWFSPRALFMGLCQQETFLRTVQK